MARHALRMDLVGCLNAGNSTGDLTDAEARAILVEYDREAGAPPYRARPDLDAYAATIHQCIPSWDSRCLRAA
jgi:hypothetical protein